METGTLNESLLSAAKAHAGKTAFTFFQKGWKTVSYGKFSEMAYSFSSFLRGTGTAKGDRVALISENRVEWCIAYLGILMARAVAVPVDARMTTAEVRNILLDSGARSVVHTDGTGAALGEAASGLDIQTVNLDFFDWKASPAEGQEPADKAEEEDLASLLYTSGTTGSPKGVMLTHANLLSDARAVMDAGIITEEDVVLSVLPLHHTYAFMCTFVVPVLSGGSVTYPEGLKGPAMLEAIRETGVTVLIGVPQLLELMLERIAKRIAGLPRPLSLAVRGFLKLAGALRRRTGFNLAGLMFRPLGRQFRFFTSGGARLDPKVMKGLEELGFTVLEGYGLTETSPIVCFNPPGRRKPGSVGKAVPSAEIRILEGSRSDEKAVPSNAVVGEIAVRGPMVMKGYYRKPEETEEVLSGGWFRTGDQGYLDGEGYLFVTGRLKEVIVLATGKNVYPDEVEKHYVQSPLIKEICVLEHEGRLRAVVVPDMEVAKARGVGGVYDAIKWEMQSLAPGLPPHMRVKGFSLSREPFPRTPLGKLKRFAIVEGAAAAGPPLEDDARLLGDEMGRKAVSVLKGLLPEKAAVREGDNLELDLGLDSLARVELAASLERELSTELPDDFIAGVHTVGELVAGLKELGKRGEVAGEERIPAMEAVLFREPPDEEKKRAGMARGPLDWPLSVFFRGIMGFLMRAVFRLRVEGTGNLPAPPFLLAANHASYLDGFAIGAALPRKVFKNLYFLGERRFFRGRITSAFARLAHVITVDRDARLNQALRLSSSALRSGNAMVVFPEGGRSADGEVMAFKKGIGTLALGLKVPVVPAWLGGTYEVLPRGRAWPRLARIRLVIGRPLMPEDAGAFGAEGEDEQQAFADEARRRVLQLKDSRGPGEKSARLTLLI